jgi:hypothetical protein
VLLAVVDPIKSELSCSCDTRTTSNSSIALEHRIRHSDMDSQVHTFGNVGVRVGMQVGDFRNNGSITFNITESNQSDNLHAADEKKSERLRS